MEIVKTYNFSDSSSESDGEKKNTSAINPKIISFESLESKLIDEVKNPFTEVKNPFTIVKKKNNKLSNDVIQKKDDLKNDNKIQKKNFYRPKCEFVFSKKNYDEMIMPISIDDAKNKNINLTLKQILILMNLYAIPLFTLNVIHDNIQKKVRHKRIRIKHNKKEIYVSFYLASDLDEIVKIIDKLVFGH